MSIFPTPSRGMLSHPTASTLEYTSTGRPLRNPGRSRAAAAAAAEEAAEAAAAAATAARQAARAEAQHRQQQQQEEDDNMQRGEDSLSDEENTAYLKVPNDLNALSPHGV